MAQQWQFVQDEYQQWHWRHAENAVESAHSFSSATECMLDAVRFAVERRRSAAEGVREDLLQ